MKSASPLVRLPNVPTGWTYHNSDGRITGTKTDFSGEVGGITSMLELDLQLPISGTQVGPAIYGKATNTGDGTGVGHMIGVLGRSFDTVDGEMGLIGCEGRVDALGSAGAHQAGLFIANWSGSSFSGRSLYGSAVQMNILDEPDIGSPVTEGFAASYVAFGINGGDVNNKWGLYSEEPIRGEQYIRCFSPDGTRQLVMAQANGADSYFQSTTNIRVQPGTSSYLILEDGLGFVPINTGALLGNGALSLNWNVHATQVSVLNTKVLGAQITGWGAPTGTATRTTFATGSVTLSQLAERVKALIDDLTTHGMIGA